ncbi:MAG TPA: hopanoid-associated sugar epimerase [Steroidobacteraceae bacterium]|jgi:dihydroflavonol-4-reductase|nr:hopanoid-associated sugar epimerase [Steroidobacteraceae bacterium]
MRALVTGATGFVGAAVARALVSAGWQVRALVRASSDRSNLKGLPVEIAVGDLTDGATLARALADCPALFHVAADYRLGTRDPSQLYRCNVEGTRNILAAARQGGVERIVYTSSVATIGLPQDRSPGVESTPVALSDMIGHYKRSKYLAEEVVRDSARTDVPVVIVNPSTPVGPGDIKPTPTGQLVLDAATGRTPAYVDTGLNIVHVDDVAAGHLLAYQHGRPGERYILGGQDMTLREILVQISRIVGRRPPRIRLPHAAVLGIAHVAEAFSKVSGRATRITVEAVRMSEKRMFFSSAKAINELGYRSRPSLEALEDAVRWFRARGLLR